METRSCQNCKNEFTIEPDDFSFYKKIKVPPPTWCWKCRAMRRMSFRNIRYLYERICSATGKRIFTILPSTAPMPVYDREYWVSDNWDPLDYGREYDFSISFFEQFRDLLSVVPATNVLNQDAVNSEYGQAMFVKNCYMCFDSGYCEDSAYGVSLQKSKQCFDTINCKLCELCYFVINGTSCYRTFFSRNVTSCVDVWFSQDCVGCTDCFGCTNLRNKSYHIFNEPYSKEEYDIKIKEFQLNSWESLMIIHKQAELFWVKNPVRYRHGFKDANCTGDYIYNSTELRNCFFANGAQNCANSQSIIYDPIHDCIDITSSGINLELGYEISGCGVNVSRTFFAIDCVTTSDTQYAINCRQGANLFGCIALRGKQYCILNKQYSKEEYQVLLPKIIEHMKSMPYTDEKGRVYGYGEFFPPLMSPIGYNESQAYEYFSLPKQEVELLGFNWHIGEKKNYPITKEPSDLPETIADVEDSILNEIIQCLHHKDGSHSPSCAANCTTAFRLTLQELQFYRQIDLPLPRLCFNCRHGVRLDWRNKPELYTRSCMCDKSNHNHSGNCLNQFETTYSSEQPEIVYCEKCYQEEMI